MKKLMLGLLVASLSTGVIAGDPTTFPPVEKNIYVWELSEIFPFDFDSDDISDEEKVASWEKVQTISQYLNDNPDKVVRIEGHADEVGTYIYNMDLTNRRIDELINYLIIAGCKPSQILRVPYSEVNPLADGHSDESWAENRRTVIAIHDR